MSVPRRVAPDSGVHGRRKRLAGPTLFAVAAKSTIGELMPLPRMIEIKKAEFAFQRAQRE